MCTNQVRGLHPYNAPAVDEIKRAAAERGRKMGLNYAGALLPAEAHAFMKTGAKLVDVRTKPELLYVGKIPGSVTVEWQTYPGSRPNPEFLAELAATAGIRTLLPQARDGAEENRFVSRPGRAGYHGGRASSKAKQRVVPTNRSDSVQHTVASGISQHPDPLWVDAETLEPMSIFRSDHGGGRYCTISWLQEGTDWPPETAAVLTHRSRHDSHIHPTSGGTSGELSPDIQLGKYQEIRFEGVEQAVYVCREIVGQVV
jgi:hypothetical protein